MIFSNTPTVVPYDNRFDFRTEVVAWGMEGLMKDCEIIVDRNRDGLHQDQDGGNEEFSAITNSGGVATFMYGGRIDYLGGYFTLTDATTHLPASVTYDANAYTVKQTEMWEDVVNGTGARFLMSYNSTHNQQYCKTAYDSIPDDAEEYNIILETIYGPHMVMDMFTTLGEKIAQEILVRIETSEIPEDNFLVDNVNSTGKDARQMASDAVLDWVMQQPYGLVQPKYPGQIYTHSYLEQLDEQIKAFKSTIVSDKERITDAIEIWTTEYMDIKNLTTESEIYDSDVHRHDLLYYIQSEAEVQGYVVPLNGNATDIEAEATDRMTIFDNYKATYQYLLGYRLTEGHFYVAAHAYAEIMGVSIADAVGAIVFYAGSVSSVDDGITTALAGAATTPIADFITMAGATGIYTSTTGGLDEAYTHLQQVATLHPVIDYIGTLENMTISEWTNLDSTALEQHISDLLGFIADSRRVMRTCTTAMSTYTDRAAWLAFCKGVIDAELTVSSSSMGRSNASPQLRIDPDYSLGMHQAGVPFTVQISSGKSGVFSDDGFTMIEIDAVAGYEGRQINQFASFDDQSFVFSGVPSIHDVGLHQQKIWCVDSNGARVALTVSISITPGPEPFACVPGKDGQLNINQFTIVATASAQNVKAMPNTWRQSLYNSIADAAPSQLAGFALLSLGSSAYLYNNLVNVLPRNPWAEHTGDENDVFTNAYTYTCSAVGGRQSQEEIASAFAAALTSAGIAATVTPSETDELSAINAGVAQRPVINSLNHLIWQHPANAKYPVTEYVISLCGMEYATVPGTVLEILLEGTRSVGCNVDIIAYNKFGPIVYPTLVAADDTISWITISNTVYASNSVADIAISRTVDNQVPVVVDVIVDDNQSIRNGETIKQFDFAADEMTANFKFLVDEGVSYTIVAHAGINGKYSKSTTAPVSANSGKWTFTGATGGPCTVDCGIGTQTVVAVCDTIGATCGAIAPTREQKCVGAAGATCSGLDITTFAAPAYPSDCESVCGTLLPRRLPWCDAPTAPTRMGKCISVSASNIRELTGWDITEAGTISSSTSKHLECSYWCSTDMIDDIYDSSWCLGVDSNTDLQYLCAQDDVATVFEDFHRHRYQGEATSYLYNLYSAGAN